MVTFLGFYPAAIFVQLERLFAPPLTRERGQIIPIVVNSENCEILFCLSNRAVCVVSEKIPKTRIFCIVRNLIPKLGNFILFTG